MQRKLKQKSMPAWRARAICARGAWWFTVPVFVLACLQAVEFANAADVFNGRQVYEFHCQSCHGEDGKSMMPGIPDFSSGDGLFLPDPDLLNQIRDGKDMMPAYRGIIEDEEILDVIAYLRSLQQ